MFLEVGGLRCESCSKQIFLETSIIGDPYRIPRSSVWEITKHRVRALRRTRSWLISSSHRTIRYKHKATSIDMPNRRTRRREGQYQRQTNSSYLKYFSTAGARCCKEIFSVRWTLWSTTRNVLLLSLCMAPGHWKNVLLLFNTTRTNITRTTVHNEWYITVVCCSVYSYDILVFYVDALRTSSEPSLGQFFFSRKSASISAE